MKLLAIESASEACSAALAIDGDIAERFEHAPRRHGELLPKWVDWLVVEAGISRSELDAVAVSAGPGSFVSLRVGFGLALGIAYGLNLPIHLVSSLAALAQCAVDERDANVLAALDARMGEVYAGTYRVGPEGRVVAIGDPQLAKPEAVALPETGGRWVGVGNGFTAEDGALAASLGDRVTLISKDEWPRARHVAVLARDVEPVAAVEARPVYLRERVAHH